MLLLEKLRVKWWPEIRDREHGNVLPSEQLESKQRFWSAGAQQVTDNR